MSKRKKSIEEFFENYENIFNKAIAGEETDAARNINESFADCFVESSPAGLACAKRDDQFAAKIREGFEFYRNIGSTGMKIISKETTLLDDFHAMTKIYWQYAYEKDGQAGTIDFNVFYFLRTFDQEIRIFCYIAGDEQKALAERGLVPKKAQETVAA